jgi:hypothetical protein
LTNSGIRKKIRKRKKPSGRRNADGKKKNNNVSKIEKKDRLANSARKNL